MRQELRVWLSGICTKVKIKLSGEKTWTDMCHFNSCAVRPVLRAPLSSVTVQILLQLILNGSEMWQCQDVANTGFMPSKAVFSFVCLCFFINYLFPLVDFFLCRIVLVLVVMVHVGGQLAICVGLKWSYFSFIYSIYSLNKRI